MAKTKTWKIGEYCQGGVLTVEITGKVISVIGKEWDHSAGIRKSSNQSKAQEFRRGTVLSTDAQAERKLLDFLCELTTGYYADMVLQWIKKSVTLNNSMWY